MLWYAHRSEVIYNVDNVEREPNDFCGITRKLIIENTKILTIQQSSHSVNWLTDNNNCHQPIGRTE